MAKRSTIITNWPKYLLQWGVLVALIVFITGLIPSEVAVDPEAYCPMGGLQALATYLANNSLPCSMSSLQVMMGIALIAAVVLFSKLFCAFICPLGTVQDLISKARNAMHIKSVKVRNGSVADKVLRIVKYALLFWIFYSTVEASELFCKNLDPYYAIATGFKGEITLWMSIVSICMVVLDSFLVDMFWCRYLCPLGAISNTLKFWLWIGVLFGAYYLADVLGANIPWAALLGAFCVAGYLLEIFHAKPKLQVVKVQKNMAACNNCGLCMKKCPYHIDIKSCQGAVDSVDCTLCGECVASCKTGALQVGVTAKAKGKFWNIIPAILTVALVAFGMWAGGKFELPTIDMKWGMEVMGPDSTMVKVVDMDELENVTIEGLRSVKCYGSSMAFKAKLQKIQGVYGVKVFVKRHAADVLYNPAQTNPDKIQEAIFVPSKFRIMTPDPAESDSLKVVVIRTEGMYDKMDINYLGMQLRLTGKKLYGIETEFACPLIVRVYMDPSEELDEDWFEDVVEKKELVMPVHGGGEKIIEVDYDFVTMEDGVSYISTEDFIRKMFNPFRVQWKSRIEKAEGKQQYIYEIVDKNYEKPIILRNMPFLSNHLSTHEGVIGVYLDLNKNLQPAIQIRFAEPMTAERLWELMTMETWTITYKADDIRQEPAKLNFKSEGTVYEYTE
ncbi:MAG: 4Fe-4S binding protein [Bacteroidales bacterium]|nr:4Fe-4S binding protein [Bacteroidales bacterium]MBR5862040.1 4Fe-4S binding protein [Bacteroidales bacterium]